MHATACSKNLRTGVSAIKASLACLYVFVLLQVYKRQPVCICLWPCLSVLGAKLRSICAVLHPHFRVGGSFVIQFVVLSSRHALLLCDVHSQCLSVCDCPAVVCVRWTGHSARVRMSSFDLSAHFCNYICFGAFIPALPYLDKQSRRATCRKRMLDAAVIHHTAWCHITFSECQHSLSVMCGSWQVEHSHAHLHRCTHCNGLRV